MSIVVTGLGEREFFPWYSLLAEYASTQGAALTDEQVMRIWTALQAPGAVGLVAHDDDGEVVGLLHAVPVDRLLTGRPARQVEDLFVSQDARGRGVATALLDRLRERSQADGAALRWAASDDDPAASALSDRLAADDGALTSALA